MKSIEEKLQPLSGYLISIKRNTVKGWYELEVGIPSDWIYKSNEQIECEAKKKTDVGHLLTISPKNDNITIDDLIDFVKLIIETNSKIREREKEFNNKMNKVKEDLENEAKKFYKELDELKEKSFNNFDVNVNGESNNESNNTKVNNLESKSKSYKKSISENNSEKTTTKKSNRGRPPKSKTDTQKEVKNGERENK